MNHVRRLDLRLVLLVAFIAAAIWAATALAGGSQPASDNSGGRSGPANVFVQEQWNGDAQQPPSSDDCPNRGDDGSGGGAPDV